MPLRLATLATALMLAGSAHAADKIKVGFVSTLSGPGAGLGVDIRDGFNLALKQQGGKLGDLPAEIIGDGNAFHEATGLARGFQNRYHDIQPFRQCE